jgi:acetate kinase
MKLDIVINETGLRREINRNAQTISELQKLNSTCSSSADLEDIKHAIATLQLKLEGLQMPSNDDISNVGERSAMGNNRFQKILTMKRMCISPQIWNSTKIRLEISNKNIMNSGRLWY